jgi:hypothetical protein
MNPAQFWSLEMQNQQDQQDQAQQNTQNMLGAISTVADAFTKKEKQKSDAKIYGNLIKLVAPAFGKDGNSILEQYNSLESDEDKSNFGGTLLGSLGVIGNMYAQTGRLGLQQNAPIINAGLKGAERVAGGEGTVPLPEEPPLPVVDDSTLPPSQPRQPSPDAISAASAWYNQSNRGVMQSGSMPPFWRQK